MRVDRFLTAIVSWLCVLTLVAPAQVADTGATLYVEQIRPLFVEHCLLCHSGDVKKAGLDLSTRESLLRGSDNGAVVVPGNAAASLLIKKIRHEHDPGMPYKALKLSDEVIAQMTKWINDGAPYDEPLKMQAASEQILSQAPGSNHWAFQPPKRVVVPTVKNQAWVRNPIDAFIAAEHEKRGLKPVGFADKRVLLRRVYLDLIGLPPTPEETRTFLDDTSPRAYEEVVDRLLSSPRYGERWGRHWMDIWRYSDRVYGQPDIIDFSQAHIWHWRDWIIESLNQDKGYDRMITEMLAGDEIAPTDPQTIRATGFLARNWYRYNRNVWLQDVVGHTAAGFLGITLKCARCHDHKYDPIAQEEFYRFRAFFEPYDVRMDRLPGQPDIAQNALPRVYDSEPKEATKEAPFLPAIFAQTFRFIRGDEKSPDAEHPLIPGVPEALGNTKLTIEPVRLPVESFYPDLRPAVLADLLFQGRLEIQKTEAALSRANRGLEKAKSRMETPSGATAISSSVEVPYPKKGDEVREADNKLSSRLSRAANGEGGASPVSFEKDVKPILERNCLSCHGAKSASSGLVLETLESIMQGGDLNGPAVVARKSAESPLILYLLGEKKPRMPLGGASLPEEQIGRLRQWIDQLPEEEPERALRKAAREVALAGKRLAAVRAGLPALEARIVADKAKYSEPPDPQVEKLAETARKTERQAHLLKAEESLLRAQYQLAEALEVTNPLDELAEKTREKKIGAAQKQLQEAQTALGKSVESYSPVGAVYPKSSTGRRLALARWITDRENPLTARVAVNHMWLRHFGKALVPTVSNFGVSGKPPTHPELLDWLAGEFMDRNWSMKALHRLMVTSNTYRMQSSTEDPNHPNIKADRENRWLWRMNPRRMEGEVVRDSVLHLAGQLDTTMGGADLDETKDQESHRRSVYFRQSADAQPVFLKVFDGANPEECYERNESIIPQQALALANSRVSLVQARLLARHINNLTKPVEGFIQAAFDSVLNRPPSTEELEDSQQFLARQAQLFSDPKRGKSSQVTTPDEIPPSMDPQLRARENLVQVLFNHNDFVMIR